MAKSSVKSRTRPARTRGRPFLHDAGSAQVAIRFPKPMLDRIETEISRRIDGVDRATLIRELVADGMKYRGWIKE